MANRLGSTVIRYSVTTLVVSMTLITVCIGTVTWHQVHSGGVGWAQSSARASLAFMTYLRESWDLRGQSLAHDTPDKIRLKLDGSEVAFVISAGQVSQTIINFDENTWFNEVDIDTESILEISSSGYYKIGQIYSYIQKVPYKVGSSYETLILVRHLAKDEFLAAFKKTSNAEIILLQKSVLGSTFVDQDGGSSLPILAKEDLKSIWQIPKDDFLNRVIKIKVKNYAGYNIPTDSNKVITYHRGANEITAYSSFFPIVNADGSISGHIGILVPEDALSAGVKKGLYVSFIMMLALTSLSAALFSRLSRRLTDPLTVATQRILQLSKVLSQNFKIEELPDGSASPKSVVPGSAIREIAKLQTATHCLERIFYRSEEIRLAIDTERAKSFNASKMAALGEISAGIAHEINTPLAAISVLSGQIQSLLEDGDYDLSTVKKLVKRTEDTTFKIAKIIKSLQSYSRDTGNDPMSENSLKDMIDDSFTLCSDVFKKSSIKLSRNKFSSEISINCHPAQISQVLLHLINNARDAVEDHANPWINISVDENAENIQVRVTDSGKGIFGPVREKLFLPFFTTKPIGRATGLGLSVSEKIIQAHGGRLELDPSSPHTCFVVTLPKPGAANLPLAA